MAGLSQSDIDKLKKAIASGVKVVEFAPGRSVTYQSTEAMIKALAFAENDIAGAANKNTPSSFAVFTRG